MSIADLLEATVEEAIAFLAGFPESHPAERAVESLRLLEEVGLGYLRLGQPINTLSGGESQRLKLVRHLAEAIVAADVRRLDSTSEIRNAQSEVSQSPLPMNPNSPKSWQRFPLSPSAGERAGVRGPSKGSGAQSTSSGRSLLSPAPTLFLFDEPTTGLHFEDVRVLLKVFQRLVDAGHSVLVIEHNLEVIKSSDWIIDLGPDAGDDGGQVVATGTPEEIATCPASHTGRALRTVLPLPSKAAIRHRQTAK